MMKLVIVESPTKSRKIQEYLGKDYIVLASYGHIADLGSGGHFGIGVDVEKDFKPRYVLLDDKVAVLDKIMKAAEQCDEILLAQDADREGEGISWHLQSRLEDLNKPIKRVEFHEITKKAILEALKNPRDIDMALFRSQEARRILDRIVGFMASPFLMNFYGSNLSAGRVQSVVARMIVDREQEIESFKPEEYWVIQANLANQSNQNFVAKYDLRITNKEDAEKVKSELEGTNLNATYIVKDVVAAEEKKKPPAPLITAKLQQIMSKNFGMSPDRTMKAAQSLYENGYITYMRTDSVRANPDAIKSARQWLKENNHNIPKTANVYKNKDTAQDAHECIRPTDLFVDTDGAYEITASDEKAVYNVVRQYFLASQMMPAIYNTLKVSIELKNNKKHILKAAGKALKSGGFLQMLNIDDNSKIDIPNLNIGDELILFGKEPITAEQKYTQPPARYSEAHLIETLEKKNIGRPSTFADLLSKITNRNYVEKRGNVYHPTELGKKITNELIKFFSFMEYTYTADLEDKLDAIAEGKTDYLKMLNEFFLPFREELNDAYISHGAEICSKCKSPMVVRKTKKGDSFLSCSQYPRCRSAKSAKLENVVQA